MDDEFIEITAEHVCSTIAIYDLLYTARHYDNLDKELSFKWKYTKQDIILQLYHIRQEIKQVDACIHILRWIAIHDIDTFRHILPKYVHYGDWSDIVRLYPLVHGPAQAFILYAIVSQIRKDIRSHSYNHTISRCIRSLPREGNQTDQRVGWVYLICNELGISRREYRIIRTVLYRHLNTSI